MNFMKVNIRKIVDIQTQVIFNVHFVQAIMVMPVLSSNHKKRKSIGSFKGKNSIGLKISRFDLLVCINKWVQNN